jgi:hypothetical protein
MVASMGTGRDSHHGESFQMRCGTQHESHSDDWKKKTLAHGISPDFWDKLAMLAVILLKVI